MIQILFGVESLLLAPHDDDAAAEKCTSGFPGIAKY